MFIPEFAASKSAKCIGSPAISCAILWAFAAKLLDHFRGGLLCHALNLLCRRRPALPICSEINERKQRDQWSDICKIKLASNRLNCLFRSLCFPIGYTGRGVSAMLNSSSTLGFIRVDNSSRWSYCFIHLKLQNLLCKDSLRINIPGHVCMKQALLSVLYPLHCVPSHNRALAWIPWPQVTEQGDQGLSSGSKKKTFSKITSEWGSEEKHENILWNAVLFLGAYRGKQYCLTVVNLILNRPLSAGQIDYADISEST